MTSVFLVFFLHASLGLLAMLAFVPRQAGARFFKFCSATAAFMTTAGVGLALRRFGWATLDVGASSTRGAGTALLPAQAPGGASYPALLAAAAAFLALVALHNRAEHFGWRRAARFALGFGLAFGALSVWLAATPGPRGFLFLTALSSAWLVGASAAAMILGHWYLVVLDLPIHALRRLTLLLVLGLGARALVLAWALAGPVRPALAAALLVAGGEFDPDGVFVWMRLLFGLVAPLSLIGFIWKTVEIRSTQSATGILYVQMFLILAGELLATYLRLTAGLPL